MIPSPSPTNSSRLKYYKQEYYYLIIYNQGNSHLIVNMFPSVAEYHFFFVSLQPKYNS